MLKAERYFPKGTTTQLARSAIADAKADFERNLMKAIDDGTMHREQM